MLTAWMTLSYIFNFLYCFLLFYSMNQIISPKSFQNEKSLSMENKPVPKQINLF